MLKNKIILGHVCVIVTVFIWGTTFIATKVLLQHFTPIEILFIRFVLGFMILLLIYPHRLKIRDRKQELTFIGAGFCGICLYYLLENIALTYTEASNVGVIVSVTPLFTAVLNRFIERNSKFDWHFFMGFLLAIAGIILITFQDGNIQWNPLGDGLALLAAFVWSCYSLLTKKISTYDYPVIQTTRRIFMYGLLLMIPFLFFMDFQFDIVRIMDTKYIGNFLFLGIGASALGFIAWNFAVSVLGTIKTSVYIYMVPVITIFTAFLVLNEKVTIMTLLGVILTIVGLILSERIHNK